MEDKDKEINNDSNEMESMFGEDENPDITPDTDLENGSMFDDTIDSASDIENVSDIEAKAQTLDEADDITAIEPTMEAAIESDIESDIEPELEKETEAETEIIDTSQIDDLENENDLSYSDTTYSNFSEPEKEFDEIEAQKEIVEEYKDEIISKETPLANDTQENLSHTNRKVTVRPVKFQQFQDKAPNRAIKKNLDIMQDILLHVSVELGRTKSTIREVIDFEPGSIIELNKVAGEQVEVFVNDKLVAKGEVIVIEDKFGIRVTSTNIPKDPEEP